MAWIFGLSAECGAEQSIAEQFSHHFDEVSWVLSNGSQSQCRIEIFQDIEENWWCRVCPSSISKVGVDTPETAYIMTEVGILLYQHLRSAPTFRYALVGVEVDEFRTYSELLQESSTLAFPGLVLSQTVWEAMGSSSGFRPFSPGYVWKPYEGEVYKPLMTSSAINHHLRANSKVSKILLSSPTRLLGNYNQKGLLIEPVSPNRMGMDSIQNNRFDRLNSEILLGRYHYMLVFEVLPENQQSIIIPDYSHIGDYISIALSVLYGKRFDNHGMIEGAGYFWMPHYEQLISFSPHHYYPVYNQLSRKDMNINLELEECNSIINFTIRRENEKLWRYFFEAAKFYWSSIKSIDSDLDKAYLDLITCGEILSNYYDYSEEELYDNDTDLKELLGKFVSFYCISEEDLSFIKKRFYQVKRKFVLTLEKLINKSFLRNTESEVENAKFTEENIVDSIKAAYDLRSNYVHTGFEFKHWIEIYAGSKSKLSEVQIPDLVPNINNTKEKNLKKIIKKAPTYIGLERIIRFVLLRFLHTNGVYIHSDLDS